MQCKEIENCKGEELRKAKDTFKDVKGCKSKYSIENRKKQPYFKIDFENCVYKKRPEDTKCDFGLLTETTIFYIELKGRDVKKGIEQLLTTIRDTENCFDKKKKKARLIVSEFSKPDLTKKTKQYKDLYKKVERDLVIKQDVYTERI